MTKDRWAFERIEMNFLSDVMMSIVNPLNISTADKLRMYDQFLFNKKDPPPGGPPPIGDPKPNDPKPNDPPPIRDPPLRHENDMTWWKNAARKSGGLRAPDVAKFAHICDRFGLESANRPVAPPQ